MAHYVCTECWYQHIQTKQYGVTRIRTLISRAERKLLAQTLLTKEK